MRLSQKANRFACYLDLTKTSRGLQVRRTPVGGCLGYEVAHWCLASDLAILAAAYYWTNISRVTLFWAAFILTRPLGATVGDFLDKPVSLGGLNLSRPLASAVLAIFIVVCVLLLPQRAGRHPAEVNQTA